MPKNGACCLASLNFSEFVDYPYTSKAHFNFENFYKAIPIAIRCLDDIVDENYSRHPLKEQQEMSYNYRNIGLGGFGYATMLMKLGLKYGSKEAQIFTRDLFKQMFRHAVYASVDLARIRGNFPKYNKKIWDSKIIAHAFDKQEIQILKNDNLLRNCSLLSIAPNGTLATLLNESGGCEPEFAIKYTRRTVGMTDGEDHYYDIYCRGAREYKQLYPDKELPDYFIASQDINPLDRVKTQAIMQEYVDTAISSTVNLCQSATKEDIAQIYLTAWKLGCKGITIFRDGCKKIGILTTSNVKKEKTPILEEKPILKRGDIIDCSSDLIGRKDKIISGCGSLHVLAFFNPIDGALMEVYLSKGSTGGCSLFMVGLSRTISLLCRAGVNIFDIVDQLDSTGVCPSYAVRRATKHDTSPGSCCPMAIGKKLLEMYQEVQIELFGEEDKKENKKNKKPVKVIPSKALCPECGEPLIFEGGCNSCKNCGYSKCS